MAGKQIATANSLQLVIEKGFRIAVWVLAVMHVLLCTFQYAIDLTIFKAIERWFALILLLSSLLYLLVTRIKYPDTMYRIKSFFRAAISYEQIFMIALFLWFAFTCWIRQSTDHLNHLKGMDWYILDIGILALVLFPMMLIVGKRKAKLYIESMLHIVSIAYTIFVIWCLWHVFHLHIVTLPSGRQVGLTAQFQLLIGYHFNITGAISFVIVSISCYMMITQRTLLKVIYGIAAFIQLWVCMLSNSRTVYVCLLFLGAVTVFLLLWNKLKEKGITVRTLVSLAAAGMTVLLIWWFRRSVFIWFDSITNFRELAGLTGDSISAADDVRELTNLSGRPKIWLGALKIMISSPSAFFFGVTPTGVTPALRTYGGLTFDCAHAHNIVLQVGASMGVPAMIAFIVFIIKIVIRSVRLYMRSKGFTFKQVFMIPIIIASLLVMNLAEAYLHFSIMSSILFLACGVLTYCTTNKNALQENK